MQDIMDPGLKDYVARKAAELDEVNAQTGAGMTHFIVQFVVDARTRQVDCTTRFIRPREGRLDLEAAKADLERVVTRNVEV